MANNYGPNPAWNSQNQQQQYPQQPGPNGTPVMSFETALRRCFYKYVDFSGRASRAEFWWFQLLCFVASCIPYINFVGGVALFIPSLAVSWRRLHDTGRAGGWWFLCFIPIIGWIILLIWYCQPSEPLPNRFGPEPAE